MSSRIEDYALIGDCQTAALVGRDGSIDWLCWPRFDSDACFAALLGTPEHGRWRIAPAATDVATHRSYRGDTLILETTHRTPEGEVTVIDFMPPRGSASDVVRLVRGDRGRVAMCMELVVRFGYGAQVPWVTRAADGSLRAVCGAERVVLRTPVGLRGEGASTVAAFEIGVGQVVPFVLTHGSSWGEPPGPIDPHDALSSTEAFWNDWMSRCSPEAPPAVRRSLVTLKALTYAPSGGIVAAPTTSLPEQIGGRRNWDYRFCWVRDATLSLLALMNAGYYEEAHDWRDWLLRAVAGNPKRMQIMYGVGGESRLPEWVAEWLPGYEQSAPVRIGNAAHSQLQLDVYGELMDALHHSRRGGLTGSEPAWALQRALMNSLEQIWERPDAGIWEVRNEPMHFTYSKVMAWVALDRAVKGVQDFGLSGPVARWTALRDHIHRDVCARGYDASRNTFVRSYGSSDLDASLLLLPQLGFLPCDDARILGTIAAIERELLVDGFVLRYRTDNVDDGLPPGEGAFLACTFWLVDAWVLTGRREEAQRLFERLCGLANDVGLLAEEYDVERRRLVGNFPQAFSHIALINSAFNLARTSKPAEQRAGHEREFSPT
ncbi:GH15 family glucan-1,4-alpha-glucosidase [Panacagrimonas perspica]|uniref:Trehalase n=1 Tax=Panacagrimonas perspica TaxID=381431 RepID=A0A4V6Q473_9GAMM|nr:glycoside hydrolase family 15 protein [Panacagrimonas perspica]TDU25596.1 GH15 family glucan-1,4-alpha-glucosidase [Panacagrimonas perspica]THD03806.1 glucoamylase [Panacagrimonas perspica]